MDFFIKNLKPKPNYYQKNYIPTPHWCKLVANFKILNNKLTLELILSVT